MNTRDLSRLWYHARLVGAMAELPHALPNRLQPIVISIRLSDRCNSQCKTCRCWELKNGPEISRETAIRLIEDVKQLGIRVIRFVGGEPLLRRDIFDLLERCGRSDFDRVVVATNGLLLERLSEHVNASPITHLTVSLDGVGERNDSIRGVPGGHERVVRGLLRLKNKSIKIASTMTKSLAYDIEELIQFCRQHDYAFDVNLPNEATYFFSGENVTSALSELWPSKEDVDRMVAILLKHDILSADLLGHVARYMKERRSQMRHCMHGYCLIGVEPDGSVNPGCYVMPVGNIGNESLGDILRSPRYAAAVRRMFDLDCPGCTCGYALSVVYEKPLANLSYVRRRLRSQA